MSSSGLRVAEVATSSVCDPEFVGEALDLRDLIVSHGEVPLGDQVAEVLDGEHWLPDLGELASVSQPIAQTLGRVGQPGGPQINDGDHSSLDAGRHARHYARERGGRRLDQAVPHPTNVLAEQHGSELLEPRRRVVELTDDRRASVGH